MEIASILFKTIISSRQDRTRIQCLGQGTLTINCRDINPVSLYHINEILYGGVASNHDIGIGQSVLRHDGFDLIVVKVSQRNRIRDGYSTLLFLSDSKIGWLLVQSDPETF